MEIEVEICDRCGECFSWHGEVNGIRKVKIKERGYAKYKRWLSRLEEKGQSDE